jgi:hypothetical protein
MGFGRQVSTKATLGFCPKSILTFWSQVAQTPNVEGWLRSPFAIEPQAHRQYSLHTRLLVVDAPEFKTTFGDWWLQRWVEERSTSWEF